MYLQKLFSRHLIRKVPEITILFWIIKLLTTAMGESTSDFLVHTLDPIIAVLLGAIGFGIAIIVTMIIRNAYAGKL